MIDSFEAIRFRAFEHLSLKGLRPVNIVVGRSAAGKTALLEGIRLALGASPQIAFVLNNMRGAHLLHAAHPTREQFESLWSSLFFDYNVRRSIRFQVRSTEGKDAALDIYFDYDNPINVFMQQPHPLHIAMGQARPTAAVPVTLVPIVFRRSLFTGEECILRGTVNHQGQIHVESEKTPGPATELFPSTWQLSSVEVANWYSQLSIGNQEKEIVEVITDLFPEIIDLSVQSPDQIPALHATIKHRSRKLPVSLVSSGINKFISIHVAIRNYSPGVVLMDEIENGIYYKMYPALWEMLYKFARKSGTQLFLTTHSLECLKEAVPLMRSDENDFNLIQVQQEDGVSTATVIPGGDAAEAIEKDVDVRR